MQSKEKERKKVAKKLESRPTVAIVGFGYGGLAVATELDASYRVVVITRQNYFFHNIASLRACVEPSLCTKLVIPIQPALTFASIIHAEVSRIDFDASEIYLRGHDRPVNYDYVVVATGSSYAFPCKIPRSVAGDVLPIYTELSEALRRASRVLIVGGGPVGVELAGEIRDKYKDKPVILVHSSHALIPDGAPDRLRDEVLVRLRRIGVTVHLNQRVLVPREAAMEGFDYKFTRNGYVDDANFAENQAMPGMRYLAGQRVYSTRKGDLSIEADLAIFTTGGRVNSTCYEESLPKDALTHGKRIRVNEFLQIRGGFINAFACGDCAAVDPKLASYAGQQGAVIASNIRALFKGRPLKAYDSGKLIMSIPMGRKQGATYVAGKVFGSTVTSQVKGKDLFLSKYRKLLKAPPLTEGDLLAEQSRQQRSVSTSSLPSLVGSPASSASAPRSAAAGAGAGAATSAVVTIGGASSSSSYAAAVAATGSPSRPHHHFRTTTDPDKLAKVLGVSIDDAEKIARLMASDAPSGANHT